MLGFYAAVTQAVPREAMREAVKNSVPAGTEELNLKAFDTGWEYFEESVEGKGTPAVEASATAVPPPARA